jgi:hypothetical protein
MKTRDWIYLGIIALCLVLIYIFYTKDPVIEKVPVIKENIEKIDSLKRIITKDSLKVDSLEREKSKIVEKVIVKIEKLKTLEPDSTIILFNKYSEAYGEIDTPSPVLQEDTTVLASVDNIRNSNIISSKYEGELEKTKILGEMLQTNYGIIQNKDSIIYENSVILKKTEEAYNANLEKLKKDLKKEKRTRKAITVICSAVAVTLGYFLITK